MKKQRTYFIFLLLIVCMIFISCSKSKAKEEETTHPSTTKQKQTTTKESQPDKIDNLINSMTLEEKVGQLFLVRCPIENEIDSIKKYHLGGYVLFKPNVENKTQSSLTSNIKSFQKSSSIPLLIAIDEEGGKVNRISTFKSYRSTPFLSPQELYQKGGLALIEKDTKEKADFLLSFGINVNMAPVCDVSTNPKDYIYSRTFGKNAAETSNYVSTVVKAMKSKNIGSVLKHFPGYGNNKDTHTGIAIDNRSLDNFISSDLQPFKSGISSKANSILVSHTIVNCFDSSTPSSLSKPIHDYIREALHFDGVIMTDDLYMEGIKKFVKADSAAIMAVKAGNDIICCTDFDVQIPAVINAVKKGEIKESQVDQSVRRILQWKQDIGLI